jgi:hypothetical protein
MCIYTTQGNARSEEISNNWYDSGHQLQVVLHILRLEHIPFYFKKSETLTNKLVKLKHY